MTRRTLEELLNDLLALQKGPNFQMGEFKQTQHFNTFLQAAHVTPVKDTKKAS